MISNTDIHAFAVKWFDMFRNTKTDNHDVEAAAFADACFAFGFQMDSGNAFMAAYPESKAFNDYLELDKIIDDIDDISLLGSAIVSKWRYCTHWASSGEDILSSENRLWFITALGRLERLTADNDESPFIFEGVAKKMRIISNSICYGLSPTPDDEVEQHLTITADGRVFFSVYAFGDGIRLGHTKTRTKNFHIEPEKAAHILKLVGDYFSDEYDVSFATDVGDWEMTLTNSMDTSYQFRGSLCAGFPEELDELSNIIRAALSIPELLMFNGDVKADAM